MKESHILKKENAHNDLLAANVCNVSLFYEKAANYFPVCCMFKEISEIFAHTQSKR